MSDVDIGPEWRARMRELADAVEREQRTSRSRAKTLDLVDATRPPILLALLDRVDALEAERWTCASCNAHFPRAPLLPGADPNAGVTRCAMCLEVEALETTITIVGERAEILEGDLLEANAEGDRLRAEVERLTAANALLRAVAIGVQNESRRECQEGVPGWSCQQENPNDPEQWCQVCITNAAIEAARVGGAL